MKQVISLFFMLVLLSCSNRQNDTNQQNTTSMQPTTPKHYVFVPGSFHAAWCWYKMTPLLHKNGNTCTSVDLPGHQSDTTPPDKVTLDAYVDAVCKVIEQQPQPVTLIGHSRAGIVISQVAERIPEKIDGLVYLCAFLIPNGEPMVATALTDSTSLLVSNLIFNESEGWHIPKKEIYKDAFYHDCTEEDVVLCSALLEKEPIAPVATPLQLSPNRYGNVKKVYIHTTEDKAVTFGLQQKMVQRTPVDKTYSLRSGHSPFLSKPGELADILLHL